MQESWILLDLFCSYIEEDGIEGWVGSACLDDLHVGSAEVWVVIIAFPLACISIWFQLVSVVWVMRGCLPDFLHTRRQNMHYALYQNGKLWVPFRNSFSKMGWGWLKCCFLISRQSYIEKYFTSLLVNPGKSIVVWIPVMKKQHESEKGILVLSICSLFQSPASLASMQTILGLLVTIHVCNTTLPLPFFFNLSWHRGTTVALTERPFLSGFTATLATGVKA